ncbi:MAG: NAD(P)/FAD-dependent oxidoreductase [Chitinophagaceae bacterium]|nr:NAD(P)/FAD-dependent oxidoreductase [Chitinophagaceae bacterium]
MTEHKLYDAVIAGGGLAGLSLAIQLSKAGYSVALFEKEKYPFHKVCGEYISLESWDFIEQLGLPLHNMNLPVIKNLMVSSPNGNKIESDLGLGGFGISRYLLDDELCKIARLNGANIFEQTKVNDIQFENEIFTISTTALSVKAKVVAGTFGKRSNLDVKWSRKFLKQKAARLNNYIGVKYHVTTSYPAQTIALHNFKNGYCGISKIEENKYCLCYLTTATNLRSCNNSIAVMEKNILQQNPFLKQIFSEAAFLYSSPVTISQISFEKKSQIENHVLMIGDAAGMITPLCGNGMSMAFHGSKFAFETIDSFLKNACTREQMEVQYSFKWNRQFARRLRNGRFIQSMFGKEWVTNFFIRTIKHFPYLIKHLIKSTHGKPF